MVSEYLKKLLSIEIPKEQRQIDSFIPINTILCLSLEAIHLLYRISRDNMEYLGELQLSFTKYLTRIKDFLSAKGEEKFVAPNKDFFRELTATNINLNEKKTKVKQKEVHYIVFHDYKLTHETHSVNIEEDWKYLLCELLRTIKLKPYSHMLSSLNEVSPSPFNDLLRHIKEDAEAFHVSELNKIKAAVLADLLMNYTSGDKEVTCEMVLELTETYRGMIESMKVKKKKIKEITHEIMNNAKKYYNKVRAENVEHEDEIIPMLVAEALISSKNSFAFCIEEVTIKKTTTEGSPSKRVYSQRITLASSSEEPTSYGAKVCSSTRCLQATPRRSRRGRQSSSATRYRSLCSILSRLPRRSNCWRPTC
eukprot:TRINITY_DN9449_c0_g2_i1.p1 TRINITY_DN9449_c0_g2~~TRINITY_DN9449_c0_g2_i1.p1  ORF type:complete len:365 (-),score=84.59 TRINITY_DN9449_c0_g2_i1:56-1150(-)